MKCQSCGASIEAGAIVCAYCGTQAPATPAGQLSPTVRQRFARLRHSEAWRQRNSPDRLARLPRYNTWFQVIVPVLFFSVFVTFAVCFMGAALTMMHDGPGEGPPVFFMIPFILVPLLFVVVGVGGIVRTIRRARRVQGGSLETHPARIAGRRTQTHTHGRHNNRTTTSYHATFEYEDGARREYRVNGNLYGRLAEDDMGVLYRRADWIADFERVEC